MEDLEGIGARDASLRRQVDLEQAHDPVRLPAASLDGPVDRGEEAGVGGLAGQHHPAHGTAQSSATLEMLFWRRQKSVKVKYRYVNAQI